MTSPISQSFPLLFPLRIQSEQSVRRYNAEVSIVTSQSPVLYQPLTYQSTGPGYGHVYKPPHLVWLYKEAS